MTLCLSLIIKLLVLSWLNVLENFSATVLNNSRSPTRIACKDKYYNNQVIYTPTSNSTSKVTQPQKLAYEVRTVQSYITRQLIPPANVKTLTKTSVPPKPSGFLKCEQHNMGAQH